MNFISTLVENYEYLLRAALGTIRLVVVSVLAATVLGILSGVLSAYSWKALGKLIQGAYYIVRSVPVLVIIYISYYLPGELGLETSSFVSAVFGLVIYFMAFISEVTRGAILDVPSTQFEAGLALGLAKRVIIFRIIIPQALRSSVPLLLNLWVILVKSSAYASVLGVLELTLAAKQISERTFDPLPIFGVVLAFYFVICTVLETLGEWLHRRRNGRPGGLFARGPQVRSGV